MKKLAILLFVAGLMQNADAIVGNGNVSGRVNGYRGKRERLINEDSSTGSINLTSKEELAALEKAKKIKHKKIVFPEDAKHGSSIINRDARIESLCGYELGTIVKLPRHPQFDNQGNIVISEKLKKPFRKCTHAELKYSKTNNALYSICVYSPAQKKIDEKAAVAEIEAMATAIKTKFGDKIVSSFGSAESKQINFSLGGNSFQQLKISTRKEKIAERASLKGPANPRAEDGWAIYIILTDLAMQAFEIDAANSTNTPYAKDLNAL